jgi:hypothetical protein
MTYLVLISGAHSHTHRRTSARPAGPSVQAAAVVVPAGAAAEGQRGVQDAELLQLLGAGCAAHHLQQGGTWDTKPFSS